MLLKEGLLPSIEVEVGGKGAGKVDLHISQAKHIWCIYTLIRQKQKNVQKNQIKCIIHPENYFRSYLDVIYLNLHFLSSNRLK